jgi:hypothetical protein
MGIDSVCRFIQNRGAILKNRPRRTALSAVIGHFPLISPLMQLGDTSMSAATTP